MGLHPCSGKLGSEPVRPEIRVLPGGKLAKMTSSVCCCKADLPFLPREMSDCIARSKLENTALGQITKTSTYQLHELGEFLNMSVPHITH